MRTALRRRTRTLIGTVGLIAFVMLYVADLRATALGLAPQWYPALRRPLTLVVSISLLLAWASLLRA